MLRRSTIQLLRFPFSLFLLPVYLFALSQMITFDRSRAIAIFFILHVLVYPASNGYNSFMDRDETPIGGVAAPMQPTRQLFHATIVLDAAAILLSAWLVHYVFALGVLVYIVASRAYSWRSIRLKRFPVIGFLTVFIFQGAWVFWTVEAGAVSWPGFTANWIPALAASCLIGALYPLTQVFQHESDRADGVTTLSMVLGKRGSFVFSGILFGVAAGLLLFHFHELGRLNLFYRFLVLTLPVVAYFLYWAAKVWRNEGAADFRHSLWMNAVATTCTTVYFLTLILMHRE